jgi:hypothetical protein
MEAVTECIRLRKIFSENNRNAYSEKPDSCPGDRTKILKHNN